MFVWSKAMAKRIEDIQERPEILIVRPKRAKLSAEESLKRMEAFPERKGEIVAAVRKSKGRSVSS